MKSPIITIAAWVIVTPRPKGLLREQVLKYEMKTLDLCSPFRIFPGSAAELRTSYQLKTISNVGRS